MNTILLLEDDANLNRGISLKLRKEGYDVYSAFTVKEAEDLFSACSPDLIISDITLPVGAVWTSAPGYAKRAVSLSSF